MRRAWLRCDGAQLIADPAGALVWPERSLLVVADLHLEKASALARRGSLLPPYDTRSTLARLEAAVRRWRPRCVISLGDGFHDGEGSVRLAPDDRARLERLIAAHDWLWVVGNHDPIPSQDLGGRVEAAVRIDGITLPRARPRSRRRRDRRPPAPLRERHRAWPAAAPALLRRRPAPAAAARVRPAGSTCSTRRSRGCSKTAFAPPCSAPAASTRCPTIA